MAWIYSSSHLRMEGGEAGIEIFFDEISTVKNVAFSFSFVMTPEDQEAYGNFTPSHYEYEILPDDYDKFTFTVTNDTSGVTITADTIAHIFPVKFIRYMDQGGQVFKVPHWRDLPDTFEELVEVHPDKRVFEDWVITVYVVGTDGTRHAIEKNIKVWQDWEAVKLKTAEVMKRAIGYVPEGLEDD